MGILMENDFLLMMMTSLWEVRRVIKASLAITLCIVRMKYKYIISRYELCMDRHIA